MTRGRSSVRYGTRLGDLRESWFILFSHLTLNTHTRQRNIWACRSKFIAIPSTSNSRSSTISSVIVNDCKTHANSCILGKNCQVIHHQTHIPTASHHRVSWSANVGRRELHFRISGIGTPAPTSCWRLAAGRDCYSRRGAKRMPPRSSKL